MTGGQDMWQHLRLSFPTFPLCICTVPCWDQSREADPSPQHPGVPVTTLCLCPGDFPPVPAAGWSGDPAGELGAPLALCFTFCISLI